MALTEQVVLDIQRAQAQINQLEQDLLALSRPINVPVNVGSAGEVDALRRDLGQADNSVEDLNRELDQTDRELDQIEGSARRAGKEIEDTGRRGAAAFSGIRGQVGATLATLAAFVGAQQVGRFFAESVTQASNFEESLSKANVVFGQFADNVEGFADTGPQALGLSTQAALEATATFGNLFTALGLSQEAAANLSPEIVQLAADLASFNNVTVDEAILSLRSGLVGEVEPLRRFGVAINAAVVEAKALELGLAGSNGEISEAAKVQARYALILEQTTNAQGDFARTADGFANSMRTLGAEVDNAQARIGAVLIPTLVDLVPLGVAAATAIGGLAIKFAELVGATSGAEARLRNIELFAGVDRNVDPLQTLLTAVKGLDTEVRALESRKGFRTVETEVGNVNDEMRELVRGLELTGAEIDRLEQNRGFLLSIGFDDEQINNLIRLLKEELPLAVAASADQLFLAEGALGRLAAQAGVMPTSSFVDMFFGSTSAWTEGINNLQVARGLVLGLQDLPVPDLGAEGIGRQVDAVADAMTAFGESMEDDEGKIIEDLETFFANFNAQLAAQEEFQRNISILRQRGQDLLANFFQAEGLPSAGLLAQAVADPTAAANEQRILEEHGAAMARAEFSAFDVEIRQLIAGYESMPVTIPVQIGTVGGAALDPFVQEGFNVRGDILNVNVAISGADMSGDDARGLADSVTRVIAARTGGQVTGIG